MTEVDAYKQALQSGQYAKPQGLLGKYDNVRRFWEDEEMGFYLRPFMEGIVSQSKDRGKKLRILDIGCGSGDGLDVISVATGQPPEEYFYKGFDINEGLLKQARDILGERENLQFEQADMNEFDFSSEGPYDLYLANYGTVSHNADDKTSELLAKIVEHGKNGAIICLDWLGRYAYEWQTLWTHDYQNNQWMDYVISYIYSGDGVSQEKLSSFPLRIMSRDEVTRLYEEARGLCGSNLNLRKLMDRSSFVGRHQDTAQYNPYCKPLRAVINRLFEPNVVTELDELFIDYHPVEGFDEVNGYHQSLANSWNHLVNYTKALLEGRDTPPTPVEAPQALKNAINALNHVAKAAASIPIGHPRAFLFEPQLAYCLRELEMELQRGYGCGHGLVGIFEITK